MEEEIIETLKAPKEIFGKILYSEISLNQALAEFSKTTQYMQTVQKNLSHCESQE